MFGRKPKTTKVSDLFGVDESRWDAIYDGFISNTKKSADWSRAYTKTVKDLKLTSPSDMIAIGYIFGREYEKYTNFVAMKERAEFAKKILKTLTK